MKIAFLSYEYPPDTAFGGIATYIAQAAQMLVQRGHHVEVFAAGNDHCGTTAEAGIVVHRIATLERSRFSKDVAAVFITRHHEIQFDVLEATEVDAPACHIVELAPDLPLVVKLHTPSFLVSEIGEVKPSLQQELRWYLGTLRRGQLPKAYPHFHYEPNTDVERIQTLDADVIAAPSIAIGNVLRNRWQLDPNKIFYVPLPYIPSQDLLNIPVATQTNTITFMGRLEVRKGILDLAKAIPMILQQCPDAKFRFVGSAWNSPKKNLDMRQYLEHQLRRYQNALEFTGGVPPSQIPFFLSKTDICVFPSRWESFGLVCLEAMAAGRGVVGSSAGGMAEILDGGGVGRLVPPSSPEKIAEAVVELFNDPPLRMKLGQMARDRVLTAYSMEQIGALQEASYTQAIDRRKALGSRFAKPAVAV